MKWPFIIFLLFFFFFSYSTIDGSTHIIVQILQSPDCFYGLFKIFVLNPFLKRLTSHFVHYSLLPDDCENFDAFGNLCCSSREYLAKKEKCQRHLNFTETFDEISDALAAVDHETVRIPQFTDELNRFRPPSSLDFKFIGFKNFSPRVPSFHSGLREISSLRAEELYKSRRRRVSEDPLPREHFAKTLTEFPNLILPLQVRHAAVFETYLVDLMRMFYPYINVEQLVKLEDFLALILFHILVFLDKSKNLYKAFALQVIQDLKGLDSLINLSNLKTIQDLDHVEGLYNLFTATLLLDLPLTFEIFLHSKVLNLNSPAIIKRVLSSERVSLIKHFLKFVDRNCFMDPIEEDYRYCGYLCHAVYWLEHSWLFRELLTYDDVNWNLTDSLGYTVLGHLINDEKYDERLRIFLSSTKHFKICSSYNGITRNVLDECLLLPDRLQRLSRFHTYLEDRKNSDDFADLLASAAVANRMDYFDRILNYRIFNSAHELDYAFQIIYQYMSLDEDYLFEYLQQIITMIQKHHGPKGIRLEHVFLMKWKMQLARWTAAIDEIQINL